MEKENDLILGGEDDVSQSGVTEDQVYIDDQPIDYAMKANQMSGALDTLEGTDIGMLPKYKQSRVRSAKRQALELICLYIKYEYEEFMPEDEENKDEEE